jgi:hypothetical protein
MVEQAPYDAKVISGDYPVMPSHINTKEHFWDSFGSIEVESVARYVVKEAQKLGTWGPLTQRRGANGYAVLAEYGWVVRGEDGFYRVTDAFVRRCFEKSSAV